MSHLLRVQVLQLLDEDMASLRYEAKAKIIAQSPRLPSPSARMPMHSSRHIVDQRTLDENGKSTPVIVVRERGAASSSRSPISHAASGYQQQADIDAQTTTPVHVPRTPERSVDEVVSPMAGDSSSQANSPELDDDGIDSPRIRTAYQPAWSEPFETPRGADEEETSPANSQFAIPAPEVSARCLM